MSIALSYKMAWRNIVSAKLRSFLAILGILVGTASIVALILSSELATSHALAQFKSLGTNLLSVYLQDQNHLDDSKELTVDQAETIIHHVSGLSYVGPVITAYQSIVYKGLEKQVSVVGVSEDFQKIAKLSMQSGRFISSFDKERLFCVVGNTLANEFLKQGLSPLYHQVQIGNFLFTIIGVLNPWSDSLFIPADLNQSILIPIQVSTVLSSQNQINTVLLVMNHDIDVERVKAQVTDYFRTLLPNKVLHFNSAEQIIHLISKSRETYEWLLVSIASISLVVGGIGVMNIMLVSVIERRREIGIRMAIGARSRDILLMFLIETIILTLFGGVLGIIVGVLASIMISELSHWEFHWYVMPIVAGFVVSVFVGIVSGIYPAWRAAKSDPIESLSSE